MNVLGGWHRNPQRSDEALTPLSGALGRRPPRLLLWLPPALLGLAGCTTPPPPTTPLDLPSITTAHQLLDQLPLHRADYYQAPYPYDRSHFGQEWYDVDNNGRGTRDDILAAQLADVTYTAAGDVATGTFIDPYTGLTVSYVRGREERNPVVVDHVVSLWEAWATGAWAWTPEQRVIFANDPLNLVATTYDINELKGPQNVARWHPTSRPQECEFALRVIATKAKYQLEIHAKDRNYLKEALDRC